MNSNLENLVVNANFNKEFAQLINESTKEIEDLLYIQSSRERRPYGHPSIDSIDPKKKMALVLMYYTGRDSINRNFESDEASTAWFQQELYLNYETYFLMSGKPDEHKSINFEMSEFAIESATSRFYNLYESKLSIYSILRCLVALSKDLKDICDFGLLMVHSSYRVDDLTMECIQEFDKLYDADIRCVRTFV